MIVERQPHQESPAPISDTTRILKSSALGLAGFAVLYLFFLGLYLRFPYLRPGDNLVADVKHTTARNGNFFRAPKGNGLHVMAFGYSKMLAGFKPDLFDSQLAASGFAQVESYNFGLPGDTRFVDDLEAMAAHGTAPDIALLTFPWPAAAKPGPTFFHFINNDQELMNNLFPFHHLPRNLFILLGEARGFRNISKVYEQDKQSVFQVERDRGYYFISRQSHYANDELPKELRLPTDKPTVLSPRVIALGPIYQKLASVLAEHKIKCIFVPDYFREGEFAAPPPINVQSARLLAGQPDVSIDGPDYWLYPNNLFSDPVHANRHGADIYTRSIAALVANWLHEHKAAKQ